MNGVLIDPHALKADLLDAIIEDFVTREGTDYGESEQTLDKKVAHVRAQIARGSIVVAFDTEAETVTLLTAEQASALDGD